MAVNPRSAALPAWQDPSARPYLRIESVTRRFGETYAVDDLSLEIYQGEFFALLGSSGCGKTTLLRMLAGLDRPDSGSISIDGVDVTRVPAYQRPVNMMFQSYALFPHMSVEQNIAFGLQQEGMPRPQRVERIEQMLDLLRIGALRKRRPEQLSGGQRQRVALARCLAKHPKLLLLDEPLAALDRRLRENTQFELVNLQEKLGITFVIVTHDQEEAMTMASRIAVMDAGRIIQVDTPAGVYEYPNCRMVADFIGTANLLDGRVAACDDGRISIETGLGESYTMLGAHPLAQGTPVTLVLRPEKVRILDSADDPAPNRVQGRVEDIAYLGDVSIYHVLTPAGRRIQVTRANLRPRSELSPTWGDPVTLGWDQDAGVVLTD